MLLLLRIYEYSYYSRIPRGFTTVSNLFALVAGKLPNLQKGETIVTVLLDLFIPARDLE
jgi:hypothetical protein